MCQSTSFFSASMSTWPSLNGVTRAGRDPLNMARTPMDGPGFGRLGNAPSLSAPSRLAKRGRDMRMTASWVVADGRLWQIRAMSLIPRLLLCLCLLAPPALADDAQPMQSALRLALGKDWDAALAAAPAGVGRDVILWQKLRDGEGSLGEYEDFLSRRADWPGLPFLKEKGEEAAARSTTPSRVIAYFGRDLPQTARGAIALVQALKADGQAGLAETEAMRA